MNNHTSDSWAGVSSWIASRRALSRRVPERLAAVATKCRFVRNRMIRAICRIEGGPMWSCSYRMLMRKHFDVEIGSYSYGHCLMPGLLPRGTRIGNYCSFGPGVTVLRRNHPVQFVSQHPFFFNAKIGMLSQDAIALVEENPLYVMGDAWIGANACITPRCRRIGFGAIVGAGAVVTSDVQDFTIVGGNPARIIRRRFEEELSRVLLESRWWEYEIEQLEPVVALFVADVTLPSAIRLRDYLCGLQHFQTP